MQVSLASFLFVCLTLVHCAKATYHEINGSVSRNQTFTYADGPYLVKSDLVISQNASVFIEAGTEFLVVPNVGVHVQEHYSPRGQRLKESLSEQCLVTKPSSVIALNYTTLE